MLLYEKMFLSGLVVSVLSVTVMLIGLNLQRLQTPIVILSAISALVGALLICTGWCIGADFGQVFTCVKS